MPLEKEKPIGICDFCLEPILEDLWYTVEGKIRLHCSITCRNIANARAGAEASGAQTLERMAAGTWVRPDLIKKPLPEAVSRGISRRRKQEVAAGTWKNPSQSDEARKKLSRPRVHGDNPVLKNAISKLTTGSSMADLTDEEAEEYRAYRRRLRTSHKEELNRRARQRRADMTPEEKENQRATWRVQAKRKREKRREGRKPHSRKLLNKEQVLELQARRECFKLCVNGFPHEKGKMFNEVNS